MMFEDFLTMAAIFVVVVLGGLLVLIVTLGPSIVMAWAIIRVALLILGQSTPPPEQFI